MTFKKGDDPNRYTNVGVMAFHAEVSQGIRDRMPSVVDFIFNTIADESAPLKLRLRAAKEALDRGLGRPIDTTVLIAMDNDTTKPVDQMSDDELFKLASSLAPTPTRGAKSEIIDAEFTKSE